LIEGPTMTSTAKRQQLDSLVVTDDARRILVRALRAAFPHPRVPDGPYERTAQVIIGTAAQSRWSLAALMQGLRSLDSASSGTFLELDDVQALVILKRIEHSDLFAFVRRLAVLHLYDDHELWDVLGYEGSSFDQGGCLRRDFKTCA
jgi:hypothetical protein